MKKILMLILVFNLSSCSFYSVKTGSSNELGILESESCGRSILGIPLGTVESPTETARRIGIDEISLVTEEIFFPIIPIYISICTKISGVSKRNYQERQKFFNQQLEQSRQISESNENFDLVLKKYEVSCQSGNAEDCWIITYKAALMNRIEDSLKFLESALSQGWNNWKHLESDKDIENIRNLDRFKVLVKKYKK